jgi:PKD repeat protein
MRAMQRGRGAAIAKVLTLTLLAVTVPFSARALAATSSYAAAITADGPVSYWRLGEASGSVAADQLSANPGAYKPGTTLGSPGALPADADTAVAFNGSSGYVSVANATTLNPTDNFTVEAWAKPAALAGTTQAVLHKGGSTGNSVWQYRIGLTSGNKWRGTVYVGATAFTVTDPGTPSTANWTHLAMTASQGRLVLYVNGNSAATASFTGAVNTSTGILAMGRTGAASSDYFRGSIDEVAVYPVPLSATQVANHYAVGSAVPPAPPTADFTVNPASGTVPLTVAFTDQSSGSPTSWRWDFGDGTSSTSQSPTHTYAAAGTFTVSLTAANAAGSNTATKADAVTATPPPPPTADFSATPTTGGAPLEVAFADRSAGAPTSWSWDLGDGGRSTAQNPAHTYDSPGSYTVSLTVTNAGGSDTATKADYVVAVHVDPVLVGAGDIADCGLTDDEATGALVAKIPGTVFTTGDNAYDNGTAAEFANCYDPSWGRFKARTRPAPGNHDYNTPGATGYYGYFGSAAGDPAKGYYSYDYGGWHVVVLNAECDSVGGCGAGSAQELWLRADLAAHPTTCTAAMWHEPRFSSGTDHGDDPRSQAFWEDLYYGGADVIINGHDHDYERFAPMDAAGNADATYGIRAFVVGTGGKELNGFVSKVNRNSVARDSRDHGVLKLTLHDGSYDWEFVPVPGGSGFTDSGTASCVTTPAPPPAAPTAAFDATPTSGDAPLAVTFTDQSLNQPSEWAWDFGDGTTSTLQSPLHTYTAAGTYTVRLAVRNYTGSDSATRTDLVTVTVPPPPVAYATTVQSDSPSGYWRLGELSGTSAADQTGAAPGTIKGGVTLGTPGALVGDSDTAMTFDGGSGYASVANRANLDPTGDLTVEAWVKPAVVGTVGGAIVHKGGSTGNSVWQYRLSLTSAGKWRGTVFSGTTAFTVTDPGTPSTTQWTYLAVTRSGSLLTLYVNGVSVATAPVSGATNSTTGLFAIGRTGSSATDYFNGAIDEVAFYPSALSSSRIYAHYTAGQQLGTGSTASTQTVAASLAGTSTVSAGLGLPLALACRVV